MKKLFPIIILVVVIGGIIYYGRQSSKKEPSNSSPKTASQPAGTNDPRFSGMVLAGTVTPLVDFQKDDYEAALKTNKLIVLYFYANWCPICKTEVREALYPAFNQLKNDQVIGFRVNFNDNETDTNEEALARKFGVAYQHTKVFVRNGERILKSPESWNLERYLTEIKKATFAK